MIRFTSFPHRERFLRGFLATLVGFLGVGGCQFKPNLRYGQAATDLAPQIEWPSADLATLRTTDLASGATLTATDLGRPASADQLGPCTLVSESFAADPSARWTILGDARYDASTRRLELTSLASNVAGSAFFNQPIVTTSFDATFTFRIGDGLGADGLAFVLARATSASELYPFGNQMLNEGYGIGYQGMAGYAVELDTFQNLGQGDPNGNHVGFMRAKDGAHLLTGTPSGPPLRSATARRAHIRLTGAHVTVEIDGAATIDGDLADGPLPPESYFFGFTGAASAIGDHHGVSDLTLIVGPSGLCF